VWVCVFKCVCERERGGGRKRVRLDLFKDRNADNLKLVFTSPLSLSSTSTTSPPLAGTNPIKNFKLSEKFECQHENL